MPASAALSLRDCPHVGDLNPCGHCRARAVSVCGVLAEDGLRRLAALAEPVEAGDDGVLVREGDPASHLINVTSGMVRVSKLLADGRRQIVGFLLPGDFLGLAAGETYPFTAEAIGEATACRFRRDRYRALLAELPALESALLERASHDLQAAQDHILLLGRKTADEKVASFLIDLFDRGGGAPEVDLPMTRAEIADYLGLTTETVSRAFTRLRKAGLVSLPNLRAARLERPDALRAAAG